ncbi:MAG: glycosyltransferase family 4 protein [Methanomassiliicoccus sp.]|nr:glycosyltransferase family 4 protein [Methanomassiliicoccus sp.]
MRIVQLNPYHYPYMGGIEYRLHEVAKGLSRKHEMIILTSQLAGTAPEEERDGYRIVRLPSKFYGHYNPPYVATPGVLEALDRLDPDVVDFHYRWAPSYTKAIRRYRGKWIFTFHNTYGEGQGLGRAVSLVNDALFCRHIRDHRVICITEFIKGDLLKRGFRPEMLEVIPPGIDLQGGEGREGDYILFVGRLVGTKGLPYLIRAMSGVEGRLIIVGDGPEKEKLERLARSLGVTDRVEFTGWVSTERKLELLSNCRLFVMPSLFESYGMAVAEAMTWGKPVVASRVGGLPEVVGGGGILVPPKDGPALASALNGMLHDETKRRSCAAAAKKHITRYSWPNIFEELEETYRKVAEE